MTVFIGCAGWNLPRQYWPSFPAEGSHLHRYAAAFDAVELNSSFYRPHRPQTYARWAASVPSGFRFSVKVPKVITHERRLENCGELLLQFLSECTALGDRLGCLLVQLPPSLEYSPLIASAFFKTLRRGFDGPVVIEPRHPGWIDAKDLLIDQRIAQVAADPPRFESDALPGGWPGLRYWRLHGAPKIYYSGYSDETLTALAAQLLAADTADTANWCIFDNTAAGAAVGDALRLKLLTAVPGVR